MSGAAVIVGVTLRECLRRRVLAVVALLTAAFLALYGVATHLAFATLGAARVRQAGTLVDAHALAGASLLGLAMFATLFLGAVLAVFLTFNVIRGDAEQGLLQPVVVRPIGRTVFVAARYIAACGICCTYVAIVYGAAVVITGLEGGWWPDSIVLPGVALAGGVCVVAAISLLGSVYLSTIANGIAVLMVYGAGLVSGLLGQIGYALPSQRLQEIGRDASWALPFDALYQAGLHALTVRHQRLHRRDRAPRPAGRRAGSRAVAGRLVGRLRGRGAGRDRRGPAAAGSLGTDRHAAVTLAECPRPRRAGQRQVVDCASRARSSGDRALPCGGRGRTFESCRAHVSTKLCSVAGWLRPSHAHVRGRSARGRRAPNAGGDRLLGCLARIDLTQEPACHSVCEPLR